MKSSIFVKNRLWNLTDGLEYDVARRTVYRLRLGDSVLLNKASGTTIEVGCGKGRFLDRLKASGHVQSIWGVDIDPVAVKNAYRKGFNAIRADGQKLPFKKEVFEQLKSINK